MIWFTSDLHFGHRLVSGLRGFKRPDGEPDVMRHDFQLQTNWRQTVGEDDEVWVLGDLTMASSISRQRDLMDVLNMLPGKKYLVPGNHDPIHPLHKDWQKYEDLYFEAFETIHLTWTMEIAGQNVVLSHFPYQNDLRHLAEYSGVDKYAPWRIPDKGDWLLHGHTHSTEKRREGPREIHVGLDAWDLKPVSIDEIAKIISE